MKKLKKAQSGDSVSVAKSTLKRGGKSPAAQKYDVNPMLKADMEYREKRLGEAKMKQKRLQFDKDKTMAESAMEAKSVPKKKMGGMIKRADGSMSKRGLWDNIRANKGSGKKPTAAMLKQEKKIKAQTKKK
jgi:hypothetical protein